MNVPAALDTDDAQELERGLLTRAFELSARDGWRNFRLAEICQGGSITRDRLRAHCPAKATLVKLVTRHAARRGLADLALEESSPLKDRLFAYFMGCLDGLEYYRPGVRRMLRELPCEPTDLKAFLEGATASLRTLQERLGLPTGGFKGLIGLNALLGLWIRVLRSWRNDATPDQSQTMKSLDQALDKLLANGAVRDALK